MCINNTRGLFSTSYSHLIGQLLVAALQLGFGPQEDAIPPWNRKLWLRKSGPLKHYHCEKKTSLNSPKMEHLRLWVLTWSQKTDRTLLLGKQVQDVPMLQNLTNLAYLARLISQHQCHSYQMVSSLKPCRQKNRKLSSWIWKCPQIGVPRYQNSVIFFMGKQMLSESLILESFDVKYRKPK